MNIRQQLAAIIEANPSADDAATAVLLHLAVDIGLPLDEHGWIDDDEPLKRLITGDDERAERILERSRESIG